MQCTRCEGLMVSDHLLDMQESFGPMWIPGWRCLTCGNVVDPTINKHRMIQRSAVGPLSAPVQSEGEVPEIEKIVA